MTKEAHLWFPMMGSRLIKSPAAGGFHGGLPRSFWVLDFGYGGVLEATGRLRPAALSRRRQNEGS